VAINDLTGLSNGNTRYGGSRSMGPLITWTLKFGGAYFGIENCGTHDKDRPIAKEWIILAV
jgi:hypothetical protein